MRLHVSLNNPVLFAVIWGGLAALVLQDMSVRHAHHAYYGGDVAASERVVAKEFVLVDDNGNTRARIGMNEKDSPTLQLLDKSGQTRAQLRLNQNDVPSLRLYDAQGHVRNVMGFTLNDMNPSFVTFDDNGTGHLNNNSRPDAGYVKVQDEDHTWGNVFNNNTSTLDLNFQVPMTSNYSGAAVPSLTQSTSWSVDALRQAEIAREQARAAEVQAEEARQNMKQAQREIRMRLEADQAEINARRGTQYR